MRDDTDILDGIKYRQWESDFVKFADPHDEVGHLTKQDLKVLKTDKKVFSKTRKTPY